MRKIWLAAFLASSLTMAAQQVVLRPVMSGLSRPLAIVHAGDARLFIVEQGGRIVVLDPVTGVSSTFLSLSSLVSCCGERGLLGLAFHPRYPQNGFFYVNYTDTSGNTVVARYSVSLTDPNRAEPSSALVLLRVTQPFSNHNGGQVSFGPDGYLYIALGDGGSANDPQNNGQNRNTLLGKLLRIDVDGGSPYAIPPSNPFVGQSGVRPEIWAWGLRNPWRLSFDRATGDLWIADVGQGLIEEINFQPASSSGGENYGWRTMEGSRCFNPSSGCNTSGLVLPVIEYDHSGGRCSVTGGYRYRGPRWPRFSGRYFYGDYCSGTISSASQNPNGTWTSTNHLNAGINISTFGEDASGEMYVAAYEDGVVYAIEDTVGTGPRRRSVRP